MLNKILLTLLVLSILLVGTAIAVPSYPQNENITISVPCTINGTVCSSNALCNSTIINPRQVVLVNNQMMTQDNGVFNINLTDNQTTTSGQYEFTVSCTDLGNSATRNLIFSITPDGAAPIEEGRGNLIAISIFVIVIFAIILLVLGLFQKNLFLKLFFVSFALMFMIAATLYTFVVLEQAAFSSSVIQGGFGTFWFVVKIMASVMITGFILFTLLLVYLSWKTKRGLR
jgi:hypothetical protein